MVKDLEKELEEAYEIIEWYANRKHITGTQADSLSPTTTELCIGTSIPDSNPAIIIEMGQKAREFLLSKGRMKELDTTEETFELLNRFLGKKENDAND